MAFPAKFSGVCVHCERPIKVGQLIMWSRKFRGQVWHVNCARPDADGSGRLPWARVRRVLRPVVKRLAKWAGV